MKIFIKNFNKYHNSKKKTAFEVYQEIKTDLPFNIVGVINFDKPIDWHTELENNSSLLFVSFNDPQGKEIFWHSSAHILAQAVLRHFPEALPTIGPPISEGFYYDFDNLKFSENDFEKIEKEALKIIKENFNIEKITFDDPVDAQKTFQHNHYKLALIDKFKTNLSAYKQGEFIDLCRGPHVLRTGKIKTFKILKTAAAFWQGNNNNKTLTRIYGISFPEKSLLKKFITVKEEAAKRDHRLIGKQRQFFSFQTEAPGMPFIHPKGMIIWHELIKFWKELHDQYNYFEIKTPGMLKRELWEKSGHWKNYLNNMYLSHIDDEDYAIKPMNCPGCCIFFNSTQFSYRDLPMRIAEIGTVYRHELSGVLSGLFRVRCFHQDDSHLFMQESDIESEVRNVIDLSDKIYRQFNLDWHLELSTKPENYIGTDESWEKTTEALKRVLNSYGKEFFINEGDGAFYGPKIDIHIQDALKRKWQCGTIQLDNNLPERFNVLYIDKEGNKKRPIMVHRAIYGSIERFLGILIEHFAGRFPLWISPEQVRILPINDKQQEFSQTVLAEFKKLGLRATIDKSNESLSKKIRNSQVDQVNYSVIIGDKEAQTSSVTLRTRQGPKQVNLTLDKAKELLSDEYKNRTLYSKLVQT